MAVRATGLICVLDSCGTHSTTERHLDLGVGDTCKRPDLPNQHLVFHVFQGGGSCARRSACPWPYQRALEHHPFTPCVV